MKMRIKKSVKLAIVSTHPIQYFSPWFRFLAGGQKAGSGKEQAGSGRIGDCGLAPEHPPLAQSQPAAGSKENSLTRKDLGIGGPSFAPSLESSGGASEGFDFEVFYAHRQTAKGQAEAGFGVEFEWDVPVLEGYPYRFLKNVSQRPGTDWFGGCDCPEIGEILVREGFTHVLLIGWHKKVFWQLS